MSDVYKDLQQEDKYGKLLNWKDLIQPKLHIETELLLAVQDGLGRGIARCAESNLGDVDQHKQAAEQTVELLTASRAFKSTTWTMRGVTLFVELLFVGVCVRHVNNRPPIAVEDVPKWVGWIEEIVFCWTCR